ncbi:hypothetical protein C2S51_028570 [Perilla frutescens var. frutescens]|nr:hypothetical protein C2S51_028570 [Perilla frutescens var. frutescens]
MVLQVKDQKEVSTCYADASDLNAFYSNQRLGAGRFEGFKKRLSKEEKLKLKCGHCGGIGHENSECFELIGYPDWYKKFKQDRGKTRAHCVDHKDMASLKDENSSQSGDPSADMNKIIQEEVSRYLGNYFKKPGLSAGASSQTAANLVDTDGLVTADDDTHMSHFAFGLQQET